MERAEEDMSAQAEQPQALPASVPATSEGYQLRIPERLKHLGWIADEDVEFIEFRADAHALQMTQAQFDLAMQSYFKAVQRIASLVAGNGLPARSVQ